MGGGNHRRITNILPIVTESFVTRTTLVHLENQSIWKILYGVSFSSIFLFCFSYSELFFVDFIVENSFALLEVFLFFGFGFFSVRSAAHAAVAVLVGAGMMLLLLLA